MKMEEEDDDEDDDEDEVVGHTTSLATKGGRRDARGMVEETNGTRDMVEECRRQIVQETW